MHEMGIASSVLEAVHKESRRHPGCRATKVGLRIGEYAGVDQESLRFCFEVLSRDSNQALDLEIDFRPATDDLAISFIELAEPGEFTPGMTAGAGSVKSPGSHAGGDVSSSMQVEKAKV